MQAARAVTAQGVDQGAAALVLPTLALATLVLAAVGVLAATQLRGLVAYLVVGSAGTLLLALGLGTPGTLAAGLFYLVNSTLVAAAWFLIADRIAAARGGVDRLDARLWAGSWAPLGVAFFIAAVPPMAGFFGKALLLQAAGQTPIAIWVVALVLGSSLAMMVALARAGSTLFWKPAGGTTPASATGAASPPAAAHTLAIVALLGAVVATSVCAGPLSAYTAAAAQQLMARQGYIDAVLGARAVTPAYDVRREMRDRGDAK